MSRKKRSWRSLIGVALIAFVAAAGGAALWHFWQSPPADEMRGDREDRRQAVTVATSETGTIRETVVAIGTLEAKETVELTAKVRGQVKSIAFSEGGRVDEGQTLVQLDAEKSRAALARAKAVRDEALRQYERGQALETGAYITAAEVDRRQRAYRTAAAEVEELEARLEEYTITAPFPGRIGLRNVSPGSLIEPGTVVATLSTIDPMELRFEVPARLLPEVRVGATVFASLEADDGDRFEGRVVAIDSDVNPATRTIALLARVANPDGLLRAGMFMHVELVLNTRRDVVLIPEAAVLLRGDQAFVFRVSEGVVERRTVSTGVRRRGTVEITDGLMVGDQVVMGGVDSVEDGQAVRVSSHGGDATTASPDPAAPSAQPAVTRDGAS